MEVEIKRCIDCGSEPEYLLDLCSPCIDVRLQNGQTAPRKMPDPGKPIKVSPSQIATFRDCQRKWGWSKIDRIEVPPNGSAALGSRVHAVLEDYLAGHGLVYEPDSAHVGDIAASGLEHLPEPQTEGMIIEHPFTFQPEGLEDVLYNGRIDFFLTPHVLRGSGLYARVGDHKTTSGLQWAKTPEDLREDPQGIIYAAYAFQAYPEIETVELTWVYYQTKGARKSKKVETAWTREENRQALEKINLTAGQIASILRSPIKSAADLPYSANACEKYGGCPFRANCNLGPQERAKALFPVSKKKEGNSMGSEDLRARIAAKVKAAQASTPPTAETEEEKYSCPEKAPCGLPVPPNVIKSGMVLVPGSTPAAYVHLEALDVFTRESYLDNAAKAYAAKTAQPVNPAQATQPEDNAELTAAADGKDSAYGPATEEEKPKRIRRTKAQIEADELKASQAEALQGAVAATKSIKAAVETLTEAVESAEKGYFLFVDSHPLNVPVVNAETLYLRAHDALKKEEEIPDYSAKGFGEGAGMFRLAFKEELAKELEGIKPGQVKYITMMSRAREAQIVMAELRAGALMTIQGAA